jgi:hypothetical protein
MFGLCDTQLQEIWGTAMKFIGKINRKARGIAFYFYVTVVENRYAIHWAITLAVFRMIGISRAIKRAAAAAFLELQGFILKQTK